MRERRIYEGNQLIFDARELLDARKHKGKVLVKMVRGPISFETVEGVRFWNKHPYQWVSEAEAATLVDDENFKFANKEELEDYYAY